MTSMHTPVGRGHQTHLALPVAGAAPGIAPAPGPVSDAGAIAHRAVESSADNRWQAPSWDQVVREHSARVYRLAYRLTGNQHDAEDLTHDVFIRVFRSLERYRPGTFEGWLHRITTNLFLDRVRRKQRIRFDALTEDAAALLRSRNPSPEEAWEASALDDDIQRALDALPPQFRAAVVLADIEGYSYEEVAQTLGIKMGTVRSRIHRGRSQLREALAHRAPRPARAVVTSRPATALG